MTVMDLGKVGVWHPLFTRESAGEVRRAAAEIERLGYGTLWYPEAPGGRESLSAGAIVLAATERVNVASGIASIWARDAMAAAAGAAALGEAYGGRFVLGLGVSHKPAVQMRGHDYTRPVAAMSAYLDAMREIPPVAAPERPVPVLLAALRPRMLELAREKADGVHSYFVPPEHTDLARKTLGPGPVLAPEQAVVLETDPARARAIARTHTRVYLQLPNYVNNLLHLGFSQDDVAGEGSDRLVDAIVAWGDADAIATRVRDHLDAGADHVSLQPLPSGVDESLALLRDLAPVLGPLLTSEG
ncbi:putative F420-dependent oxidoreductase [Thermocatellispora tengchongensis]|uniref:Putative F420-dependent oxidoreductase n=2 Tax=Thermocatellispora tengchongensis TaxID=1073253 RepID=A0A840P5H0_9ACTN|nr:putative F420-dependent oxidoreductase [Thermocatellispora tengchongensis]